MSLVIDKVKEVFSCSGRIKVEYDGLAGCVYTHDCCEDLQVTINNIKEEVLVYFENNVIYSNNCSDICNDLLDFLDDRIELQHNNMIDKFLNLKIGG